MRSKSSGGNQPKAGNYPVDACLASNIIEVGVDIDRLSLLTIVGQPKSTSQYIQVAGRVGRRWYERPGLVVTVLGPNNPRDRSHYERFRSYHERLYAQVEPTSVTPYSRPVLERALHAVMAAYVRQSGNPNMSAHPRPVPVEKLKRLRRHVRGPRHPDRPERSTGSCSQVRPKNEANGKSGCVRNGTPKALQVTLGS